MKNSSSQEVVKLQKNINLKSLCQGTFYKFSRLKNLEIFLATGRKLLPEIVFKNTMNISLRKTKNTDTHTHTHTLIHRMHTNYLIVFSQRNIYLNLEYHL